MSGNYARDYLKLSREISVTRLYTDCGHTITTKEILRRYMDFSPDSWAENIHKACPQCLKPAELRREEAYTAFRKLAKAGPGEGRARLCLHKALQRQYQRLYCSL